MGAPKIQPQLNPETLALLRKSLLFQEADEAALEYIASLLEEIHFKKDDPIILENEVSDHVYFVKSGSIEIVSYVPELKQVNRLAILHEGDHFSEFSVLNRSTKSGSAFALEDCHVLRMSGDHFLEVLQRFPFVARSLAIKLANLNKSIVESQLFIEYFRPELIKVDKSIPNMLPIPTWQKFGVLPLSFESGILTVAIKNPNNLMFYEYLRSQGPNTEVNIFLIGDSDYQKMENSLKAYYTGRADPPQPESLKEDVINDVKQLVRANAFFDRLPEALIDQLVPHFVREEFEAGAEIYKPGEVSEKFYIIQSGRIAVAHPLKRAKANTHVVTVGAKQGLSELSLLTDGKHHHLAKVVTPAVVYSLHKNIFTELLKTSDFSIPLAKVLASRLQTLNHLIGLKYFERREQVDLNGLEHLIPYSIISKYKIIPLILANDELTLGLVNPESEEIYSIVARYLMNFRINLEMINEGDFNLWSNQIKELAESTKLETASKTSTISKQKKPSSVKVDPVTELDEILMEGLNTRASDIHFEPGEEFLSVRFRVDGVLKERSSRVPLIQGKEIVNRIKILSEMDISMNKVPQDGQLKTKIQDLDFLARVSTVPTKKGEKAVLRVIRNNSPVVPLNMLAPDRRVVKILKGVAQARQGLFLVTGPTGSGKSTTLYSMLSELNQVGVNVMTLEDPVEKEIPGLSQIQIHPKAGLTFPTALRSFLRQDPDVIMVGEIRDAESAKIVFEAAITGHLVLSTMHTNTSLDIANRLEELGVSPVTMAAALLGAVSQRLVRANCKKCVRTHPTTEFEKEIFREFIKDQDPPETIKQGEGCLRCNGTGYLDRIPIFEIWQNNEEMAQMLAKQENWDQLRAVARKDGFETLMEFALRMVINGLTSMDEVKRCLS